MSGPGLSWSDELDEIIGGDQVVMLAYATPANGTVLLPVNNYAGRDRAAGTLCATNSSVGGWRKLERIRRNPRIALAYHTRQHGSSGRPEYVLAQGRASLSEPIPDYRRGTQSAGNASSRGCRRARSGAAGCVPTRCGWRSRSRWSA